MPTAVWVSRIQPWLIDWGTVQPSGGRGCMCMRVNVTVFAHLRDCSAVGVRGYNLWCVCVHGMWKWMEKKWEKMRGGTGEHVGWISHFCFKKNKKKRRPDENLGVNKEELLVTPAPLGLPRPMTSESEAIYSVIHRNYSISNQQLF